MKLFNRILVVVLAFFSAAAAGANGSGGSSACQALAPSLTNSLTHLPHLTQNNCVSFTVGSGTGCAWMCSYCQQQLGTTNYYFTDGVCKYQDGGCQGSPQAGKTYSCCSSS